MQVFWPIYIFLIVQRLVELAIAKRHAVSAFADGGYEVGQKHYKWMVSLHVLFFIGLLVESLSNSLATGVWFDLWFGIFVAAQLGRYWVIGTLGRYWNTRIIIIPGMRPVMSGPYRFFRHPNYVIVVIELIAIPLMFDAYITALLASLLNAAVLRVRIRAENATLAAVTPVSPASFDHSVH